MPYRVVNPPITQVHVQQQILVRKRNLFTSNKHRHKIQTVASFHHTSAYLEQSAHLLVLGLDVAVSDVANEVLEDLHVGVVAHEGLGDLRELTLVQRVLVERRRLRLAARAV